MTISTGFLFPFFFYNQQIVTDHSLFLPLKSYCLFLDITITAKIIRKETSKFCRLFGIFHSKRWRRPSPAQMRRAGYVARFFLSSIYNLIHLSGSISVYFRSRRRVMIIFSFLFFFFPLKGPARSVLSDNRKKNSSTVASCTFSSCQEESVQQQHRALVRVLISLYRIHTFKLERTNSSKC